MSIDKKIAGLLNETPDVIKFSNGRLFVSGDDAYPFIYLDKKDKLYVMPHNEPSQTHGQLIKYVINRDKIQGDVDEAREKLGFYSYKTEPKTTLGLHGRLWSDAKIISFWKYPSVKDFKRIVELLNKEKFNIDSSWQIEVYTKAMDLVDNKSVLIQIDKYRGQMIDVQAELDKAHEIHTMKPAEKKEVLKDKGYVPGYTKLKLPSKMTLAQYYNLIKKEDANG